MLALGAAFVVPNVLRWYCWRFNGTGYAAGTFVGLAEAVLMLVLSLMSVERPQYETSFGLCAVSLVALIAGTYLSRPTDEAVLVHFYRTVRPFGFWGPILDRAGLTSEELSDPSECGWLCLINVCLTSVVILGVYLVPMYLVGHWPMEALACFVVAVVAGVVLKFTWYPYLPSETEEKN